MAKSAQRAANARRARNFPTPELPPWKTPEGPRRIKNIPSPLDDGNRAYEHLETVNGKLVEFAIMIQTSNGDGWKDIVRADCDHDHIHLHVLPSDRKVSLRKINTQNDVVEGYHEAKSAVYDAYNALEERA